MVNRGAQAAAQISVSNWWPVNGSSVTGTQPFKGAVSNMSVNDYDLYWSVDGGSLNTMPTSLQDYPHKEALVNVSGWNWEANHQYKIAYIAKNKSGQEIARTDFTITANATTNSATTTATAAPVTSSVPTTTTTPMTAPVAATTTPPSVTLAPSGSLASYKLFVGDNAAQTQANQWRTSRPADAAQLDKIGNRAQAKWFGGWNSNITSDVSTYVNAAAAQNALPQLVAYNIPQRDCGGYSAGGTSPDAYLNWIKGMSAGIGSHPALVILEPDALANMECLSSTDQSTRYALLSQAVAILKAQPRTFVYLDAGHPGWKSASDMANRLQKAGIAQADGFSLNVSNFATTNDSTAYGSAISALVSNKHFVIDTSRNGLGPTSDNQWCNPSGRALGNAPSTNTGSPLIDAYLWIKAPGESDGTCNGGPAAGQWWTDYAVGLAQRSNL